MGKEVDRTNAEFTIANVTRRSLLIGGAAAVGAAALGAPAVHANEQAITVTCWGGSYEEAVREVFAEPFTKETGVKVALINNADLTKMKIQVDTKNVSWDVFVSVGPQIMAGSRMGLWEKIDTSIVKGDGLIVKPGTDHVGTYFFAGGIGYSPQKTPEGKHPKTFAEFWNVKGYPGRRGLRTRISETLEMALLADGVPPNKLYPLDIERGFAALDRIKPHVRKWIETTPETVTLITNGELDFTYTYISRVVPTQKSGTPVAMSLAQTLNSLEYLAVPKHGRNTRVAMDYVAFCLRPDRQAAFCQKVVFAPNTAEANGMMSEAARAIMPNMQDPNSVVVDDAWWGEHYDALQKRFVEWMLT